FARDAAASHAVVQRFAAHVLHRYIERGAVRTAADEAHDVGLTQRIQGIDALLQRRQLLGRVVRASRQYLDGDVAGAVRAGLRQGVSQEDPAHAAFADLLDEAVSLGNEVSGDTGRAADRRERARVVREVD